MQRDLFRILLVGGDYPQSDNVLVDTVVDDWVEVGNGLGIDLVGGEKLAVADKAIKKFNFIDDEYVKDICECDWNYVKKVIVKVIFYPLAREGGHLIKPTFHVRCTFHVRGGAGVTKSGMSYSMLACSGGV